MTTKEKFIILVDNDIVYPSDAIVLLEGDGLSRIEQAVNLFSNGFSKCILFSGGVDNSALGSFPSKVVLPLLIKNGIDSNKIILESKSTNTREQAVEVIKICKSNDWKKIILVASHYHQYRAYLTFLKVLEESNSSLIIYNSPSRKLKWFEDTGWGKRLDLLNLEFQKLNKYSKLNHIASFQSAIDYQKWKEKQI